MQNNKHLTLVKKPQPGWGWLFSGAGESMMAMSSLPRVLSTQRGQAPKGDSVEEVQVRQQAGALSLIKEGRARRLQPLSVGPAASDLCSHLINTSLRRVHFTWVFPRKMDYFCLLKIHKCCLESPKFPVMSLKNSRYSSNNVQSLLFPLRGRK